MKKIVVAPDSFKGSLTSAEVADAVERGIKDVFPQCNVVKAGVADGGEGTVEAIVKAVGGDMYAASVTDPLGRPVKAAYGIVRSGGVKTAVMEMSAASGLPLVMAFPRCSSVHTCFMAYPIDIAFIDRSGNVLACYENVRPWRMCSCPGAWAALERPSIIVSSAVLQRVPA